MKKTISYLLFATILFSCDRPKNGKGNRIGFSEVQTPSGLKIVAVYVYNSGSYESSDSFNEYTLQVVNPMSGAIDFTTTFSNNAYNDDVKILNYSNNYLLIKTNELQMVSITKPNVILGFDSIGKRIENANPKLKNNIGELTVFSINYLRVVSKQGDAYIISLNTFKAYKCNARPNSSIDDSLAFKVNNPLPLKNVFGPNYTQRVILNDSTVLSLECEDINNITKNYLYSFKYSLQKLTQQSPNSQFVTFTDEDTSSYRKAVINESKKQLYATTFLTSRLTGLVNNCAYVLHQSEVGKNAQQLLSKFNVSSQKIDWTLNLNQNGYSPVNCNEQWSNDLNYIYFVNYRCADTVLKFSTQTGKLEKKYY